MNQQLADLYWKSLNKEQAGDPNALYLDLGGNSIGIFALTESIRKELDIELEPSILLSEKSSLNSLMEHIESLAHAN